MPRRECVDMDAVWGKARESGIVHSCPPGQHDDLGISCAMLALAARHPHLSSWVSPAISARKAAQAASNIWLGSL